MKVRRLEPLYLTMTCVELRNIICLHRNISTETTERAVASSHSQSLTGI